MFLTGDHPESKEFPILREIGRTAGEDFLRKHAQKSTLVDIDKPGNYGASVESSVRGGITTALKSAYITMFKGSDGTGGQSGEVEG